MENRIGLYSKLERGGLLPEAQCNGLTETIALYADYILLYTDAAIFQELRQRITKRNQVSGDLSAGSVSTIQMSRNN